eukprot:8974537-Pyramimonas_sp.AAC.1
MLHMGGAEFREGIPTPTSHEDGTGRFCFDHVPLLGHSWGTPDDGYYENNCQRCEITVTIANEDDRNLILIDGGLQFDPNQKLGRI